MSLFKQELYKRAPNPKDICLVYINNLPYKVQEEEIHTYLTNMVKLRAQPTNMAAPSVRRTLLVYTLNGRSRGVALCWCTREAADTLRHLVNGKTFHGKDL